jgi:hypothetical protein
MLLLADSIHGSFEEYKERKPESALLFKPQVSSLMRKFHSLLALGFGSSGIRG